MIELIQVTEVLPHIAVGQVENEVLHDGKRVRGVYLDLSICDCVCDLGKTLIAAAGAEVALEDECVVEKLQRSCEIYARNERARIVHRFEKSALPGRRLDDVALGEAAARRVGGSRPSLHD